MADTSITICNGALARLGVSSISDFTSSDKAIICGAIYPKFINNLLSIYNWRFARKKSGSLTAGTAPDNAYSNAWVVPVDFLTLVNVYNSGDASALVLTTDYEIFGSDIFNNETACYVDYTYTVDEDNFPDYFQVFVMNALASVLAMPITESGDKENFYRQLAFGTPSENGEGGLYKQAKATDSRQQPVPSLQAPSLTIARF